MATLAASAHIGEGPRPMRLHDVLELGGNFVEGRIPGDAFETIPDAFEGVLQPLGVILKIGNVGALSAEITLRAGAFPVAPNFGDPASLGHDFEAAVQAAQDTRK